MTATIDHTHGLSGAASTAATPEAPAMRRYHAAAVQNVIVAAISCVGMPTSEMTANASRMPLTIQLEAGIPRTGLMTNQPNDTTNASQPRVPRMPNSVI